MSAKATYRTPQKGIVLTGPRMLKLATAREALADLGVEVVTDQRVVSAALDVFLEEYGAGRVEIQDFVDLRFLRQNPPTIS